MDDIQALAATVQKSGYSEMNIMERGYILS